MIDDPTLTQLEKQLIRQEGLRLTLYRCPAGYLTIGIGRNLESNGITADEALTLLENDIDRCRAQCEKSIACFLGLDPVRQDVLVNMCFNMGILNLLKFQKVFRHLERRDYSAAANEMLISRWSLQVGKRASELADQMKSGRYA